ncbi:aminoglycoside phosphotransferase family protein [Microbacterium sp. ARD31]|uniref:aminoglycoside phosphotransferase family protein n=1 Tax=Microbacterium sp. ARD31 TaxID=2962576 RepID=UPI002881E4C2|nr:aminoglycoside phosphotransferase family protein [Microbacterium sp. ARD31]MDT0187233.1 aminoglycoside phosphotransferase family protein [Microbacterium sp. ARD31]
MSGMHADEIAIDDRTVRRLVDAQLPEWAGLPLRRLPPIGTDNQLFRLGEDLLVRMPRIAGPAEAVLFEHTWLPRIAPHLSLPIPSPVALGLPGEGYPWHWTVVPWIEGANPTPETFDPEKWAVSLGSFVKECRAVPGLGGPVTTEGRGAPLVALDPWVQEWTARADPTEVSRHAVLAVWADALAAPAYDGEPCWFHGDLHEGNLLVADGRLAAVIDWGAAGRGDPAIELNAMWGYLPESAADLYRTTVGLDEAAYRRARGFALAPSISASTYYRETAPHIARGALETVRRLIASLG